MAYCGILILIFFSLINFTEGDSPPAAVPARCQPWKVPVEVDPPNHSNRPFYVEMYRCLGQCTKIPLMSPLQCECVAQTNQTVKLKVTTPDGFQSIEFQNHTSCKSQCRADIKNNCVSKGHQWNERSCTCSCPSGSCPLNKVWNSGTCECECSNPQTHCHNRKMFWNKSSCSCQCEVKEFAQCSKRGLATNMRTCRCMGKPPVAQNVANNETNESKAQLVISLVVISLVLGTLFIIDLVLMRNQKGLMYSLMTKCTERKENQEFSSTNAAETVSISMDTDVNYQVANGNHKHKHHYVTQDSVTNV